MQVGHAKRDTPLLLEVLVPYRLPWSLSQGTKAIIQKLAHFLFLKEFSVSISPFPQTEDLTKPSHTILVLIHLDVRQKIAGL